MSQRELSLDVVQRLARIIGPLSAAQKALDLAAEMQRHGASEDLVFIQAGSTIYCLERSYWNEQKRLQK